MFSVAGSDPAIVMPANGAGSDNLWIDLQISDTPPADASYRLWPNYPTPSDGGLGLSNDTNQETMGTEFTLSSACTLNRIWFYSPPGVSVLPDGCMIWDIATRQIVAGTKNLSPSWSGGPGTGWVSCAYSGVTLTAGDYVTGVYYGTGAAGGSTSSRTATSGVRAPRLPRASSRGR